MRSTILVLLSAGLFAVGTFAYPGADMDVLKPGKELEKEPLIGGRNVLGPNQRKNGTVQSSESSEEQVGRGKDKKKESSSSEEDDKKREEVEIPKSRRRRELIQKIEKDMSALDDDVAQEEERQAPLIIKPWKSFDFNRERVLRKIEMNKQLEKKNQVRDEQRAHRISVHEKMSEMMEKFDEMLEDGDISEKQVLSKINEMLDSEDDDLAMAMMALYFHNPVRRTRIGGQHRMRHPRSIGHGAAPKQHHQIGSGVGSVQQPHQHNIGGGASPNSQQNYDPYGNQHHHKKHHHGF